MPPRRRPTTALAIALASSAFCAAAAAAPPDLASVEIGASLQESAPLAPPLPLTPTSLLVTVTGPSGYPSLSCADAETLLIEHLDGTPEATRIPTPVGDCYLHDGTLGTQALVRLSPTRALLGHDGPDGEGGTGDEGVYLLQDLGGTNQVIPLAVGRVTSWWISVLDEATAVVPTASGVVLLEDLGGENRIRPIPGVGCVFPPKGFGPRAFLASSTEPTPGPVVVRIAEDDSIEITELTPLDVDFDLSLVLAPDRLLVLDGDVVHVFDDLGGSNARSELSLPGARWGAGVVLSPTRALAVDRGADGAPGTSDDALVLLDDLAGTPSATRIPAPGAGPGHLFALGADAALGETASGLVVVRGLGSSNDLVPVPVDHPVGWSLLPLPPSSALLAALGADVEPFSADDEIAVVTGLLGVPRVERAPLPYASAGAPVAIGLGRAVSTDWYSPTGADRPHSLQILSDLPGDLRTEGLTLRFRRGRPARLRASAELLLSDPAAFGRAGLRVRFGAVAQEIPAEALEVTSSGVLYDALPGDPGFLRRLRFDPQTRQLLLEGRGSGIGAARAERERLVFSLDSADFHLSEWLATSRTPGGLAYRAP